MSQREQILKLIEKIQNEKSFVSLNLRFEAGVLKTVKTDHSYLPCELEKLIKS